MTGNELIAQFRTLTDDTSIPDSVILVWLNLADTIVRARRAWEFAKKRQVIPVNGLSYTLDADFFEPISLSIDGNTWQGLSIEDIDKSKFSSGYYIDRTTSPFTLNFIDETITGNNINLIYKYKPASFTATTSPQSAYADFHILLAFEAAINFFFNDQDRNMVGFQDRLQKQADKIYDAMVIWDTGNFLINRGYGKNTRGYLNSADGYAPNV